jgi:hypothetical protein
MTFYHPIISSDIKQAFLESLDATPTGALAPGTAAKCETALLIAIDVL